MTIMPSLSSEDWTTVRAALDRLLDCPARQRADVLRDLHLAPALKLEVDTLLAAADAAEDFMEVPPAISIEPDPRDYRSLPEGARLGPFRVGSLVGRGGHGEVYEAFRDDGQFDQRVALKLLRPEAVSRFEAFRLERQFLADLDHPGLARLIDGGIAPDGRPYMAMEFVEGETIDAWCLGHGVDTAGRLRLMLRLCEAVAHAHAHLVVHGDIKPGNVLVDPSGQPRLLDFGIARLMETDPALSGLTAALSTPAYAAPEQLAGKRATIATDIYALGTLLYELLAEAAPWQTGGAPMSWATRLLHDEPPAASTRATTARRAVLRGDLDAIIAKALRADPAMRYATVQALADDIRRYLDRRPVLARNGSSLYRLRRFARRNAVVLTAVALIVVTAAIGGGATLAKMREAATGRAIARAEAGRVETLRASMDLLFRAAAREPQAMTTRQILDATAAQLRRDAAAGTMAPDLLRQMGELYLELEEFNAAAPFLADHLASATARGDEAGMAHARQLLAIAAIRRGDLAEAATLLDLADRVWTAAPARFMRERIQHKGIRAALLRQRGETGPALALIRQAADEARAALGDDSIDTLTLRQNLATHLLEMRRTDEARALFDALAADLAALGRSSSPMAIVVKMHRALLAFDDGNAAEADRLLAEAVETRRSIYGRSEALAALQLNHGRVLLASGEAARGLAVLDAAIDMSRDAAGGGGMIQIVLLQSRGLARLAASDLTGARADIEAAIAAAETGFGAESLVLATGIAAMANVELAAGNPRDARLHLDRARALLARLGSPGAHQMQVVDALEAMVADMEAANAGE